MKRFRTFGSVSAFAAVGLALAALAARAEGPLTVGGPAFVEGKPFRWNIDPLTYWTDLGQLGNQMNADADNLVAEAFQRWQDVPTANINFSAAGKLGADIDTTNYMSLVDDLSDCSNPLGNLAKDRSIVYDEGGGIIKNVIGDDPNSLLGFAFPVCLSSDGSENSYDRGLALLNGKWIDGVNTPSNPEVASLEQFQAVFIHEFGHLIGLDHTQVNVNCHFSVCSPSDPDAQGLPTMFPFLEQGLELEMATLAADDIAGLSELYPTPEFQTATGRIRGQIFFSDGVTPAQGLNVIARRVDDPRRIAVSNVSGFLFTADAGNPLVQVPGLTPSPFGSRDTTRIGLYDIPGLSPGDYTIEVEAIDQEFVGGSGVGPIGAVGFQFPMPGTCALEFANNSPPESDTDSCDAQSTFPVTAGAPTESGTDIILNGTPPRFDAWEDE